ncbi:MAG: hypothetical protein WC677_04855 [Clostridia bacterium]|jgi:hypothetical protein
MKSEMKQFKTSFIGYEMAQVDEYIENMRLEADKKFDQLKATIRDNSEENEKINSELKSLHDKKSTQQKPKEQRDFLLSRLDNVVELICQNSYDELKGLKEKAKREETEIDIKIDKLNNLNKVIQESVDVLLKTEVGKNVSRIDDKIVDDRSESKVIQYKEDYKARIHSMMENGGEKVEKKPEKEENVSSISSLFEKVKALTETDELDNQKEEIKALLENKDSEGRNDYFWKEEVQENGEVIKGEQIPVEEKSSTAEKPEFFVSSEIPVSTAIPEEYAIPANTAIPSNKETSIMNENSEKNVDNMKNRYILGKLAGENLLSKDGNLIISKNSEITEEVIQKAEQAGLLTDLIINMTIPERLSKLSQEV